MPIYIHRKNCLLAILLGALLLGACAGERTLCAITTPYSTQRVLVYAPAGPTVVMIGTKKAYHDDVGPLSTSGVFLLKLSTGSFDNTPQKILWYKAFGDLHVCQSFRLRNIDAG